ncbi:MAG: class I tRNA ligase family protein, partial [Erysipelotrichia bacterium]|nr:class I tRNA ligase family protein [Erysipelotrichia bacterium]
VHGLLMMKDMKMSKSRGNVISPLPLIEQYGVDALRYYLVREVGFGSDGQFTPEQFVERINNDLVNDFGNLLNRTIAMINKYFDGVTPKYSGSVTKFDEALKELTMATIKEYENDLDDLKITEAFIKVNNLVSRANKYIEETSPWTLAKNIEKKAELASVMAHLTNVLFVLGILMQPILVESSNKLFAQLGIGDDLRKYENIYKFGLIEGTQINKGEILFPRLEVEKETVFIRMLMGK